ncbi:MAG: YceI family protein [Gammaproteobacteria bacterium AqS3]|nr:YceI family protein [Gammaproteobacteria bacterium AqS3]
MTVRTITLIALIAVLASCTGAPDAGGGGTDWVLRAECSSLSFTTSKTVVTGEQLTSLVEVGRFGGLSSSFSEGDDAVELEVDLGSIDTGVPVRDQRVGEMLFLGEAKARVSVQVSEQLRRAAAGGSAAQRLTLPLELKLGPASLRLEALVSVVRGSDTLALATLEPVPVSVRALDGMAGLEALREVVGLGSIAEAIPVSAQLCYARAD